MATATNRPDPSFAVTAIELLQSNSALEAAQLCASGVEHYPDYIGGYVLLASAYESLGQMHDADCIRQALHDRFPGLPPLRSYAQQTQHEVLPEQNVEVAEPLTEEPDPTDTDSTELNPEEVYAPEQPISEVENTVEVDLEIDVEIDVEVAVQNDPDPALSYHPNVLRLIEMAPVSSDTRIIRSSSVRLIPGLEFTSLRFEGTRSRGRREITQLLDPPAFRSFHRMRRTSRASDTQEQRRKPVTLEELAARLNEARMPRNAAAAEPETSREDLSASQAPIMITETIARIYMQQGSYELAIEAFKALQRQKPDKHDEFEKLIKECERKRV